MLKAVFNISLVYITVRYPEIPKRGRSTKSRTTLKAESIILYFMEYI